MRRWIFLHLAATVVVVAVTLYGGLAPVLLGGLRDDAVVMPCLAMMLLCPVMVVATAGSKAYPLHQKVLPILVEAVITCVQFLAFLAMIQ